MIGGPRIGERKRIRDVEMILVLLATRHDRIGEAVVHPFPAGTRDMRHHPIEHPPPGRVRVVAAINEIPQAPARLRPAPAVCLFGPAQWIGGGLIVFQEADEIAHRDVAEAHHFRIFRGVDQLIDPAGLKSWLVMNMPIRRDQRVFRLLGLGTGANDLGRERPFIRRDHRRRVIRVPPTRQHRVPCVERRGAVRMRRHPAAQRDRRAHRPIRNDLDPHPPGDRGAVVRRDGNIQHHPSVTRQHVAFPRNPGDRVTAPHEETIPRVRERQRIIAMRRIIEELQRALMAAVSIIVEHPPVATRQIQRLQDHEIGGEFNQPHRVPRGLVQIHHAVLGHREGIDGEQRPPVQSLIGTGIPEGLPVSEWLAIRYHEFDQVGHATYPRFIPRGSVRRTARAPQPGFAKPSRTCFATRFNSSGGNGPLTE